MRIYIPSRARADQRNHTFDNLPPALQEQALFVVSKDDKKSYEDRFGKRHVKVCNVTGIGRVRQNIVDFHYSNSIEWPDPRMVMLDDDLSFFVRRKDDPTKLRPATDNNVVKLFDLMEGLLSGYAHVGIAAREGANRNTAQRLYDTRMLRALAYDTSVLKELKVRYDRSPVMEDFDVTLQLLRAGYSNCVINSYAQDQGTSNAPGGCSTYRTREVQAEGAARLKELHPDFVTVVTKETKGAWGGGERTDVRIAWKKARESANAR
jgi:hypothetical protein